MTRGPSLQAEPSPEQSSSTLVERLKEDVVHAIYAGEPKDWDAARDTVFEAATLISELQADIAKLSEPVAVHLNMLRGGIAKPSWANILHLYPDEAAALSRIQSETVEAWQPIETVLKDGSDVLLYFPLEGLSADWPKIVIGHWRDIDGTRGHWVWQSRAFRGYSDEYHPTHWQPLSPPRSLKLPDYRGGEAG